MDVEWPRSDTGSDNVQISSKPSFRDKVLESEGTLFSPEEIIDLVTEELFPGKDTNADSEGGQVEFNPNPTVKVGLEEYESWCKPWKYSLIVKLLGKRLGMKIMSQRIKSLWARKGDVRVLDLNEDFYLEFCSEVAPPAGAVSSPEASQTQIVEGAQFSANRDESYPEDHALRDGASKLLANDGHKNSANDGILFLHLS
ncbi:hypothetical protein SESBI_38539 [Sesbania bispinosa]|nr:hypothetical protein SESBI_38539 [Sesbania bispinosa]